MLIRNAMVMLVVAVALVKCSDSEPPAPSQPAIYGGRPVPEGQWNSTVGLVRKGAITCTATVVHPSLVITAAHCLEKHWAPDSISIYMGPGQTSGQAQGQFAVKRFQISPLFDRTFEGNWYDVAYIELLAPLPIAPADIIPILSKPEEIAHFIQADQEVWIVGYGKTNRGPLGWKYAAEAPIASLDGSEVYIGGDGKDACSGDSGGPAYVQTPDGSWRVFGVHSRAPGGNCDYQSIYGRMDTHVCWIQKETGLDLGTGLTCEEVLPEAH